MKLSEESLNYLKNFSSINSSLVLKKEKIQRSMSSDKTILVEAEFSETFPTEFGIYDLNQFLGNVTTLNNPDLSFNTQTVVMKDDKITLEYYACSPTLIVSPPSKELTMKNVDATFTLTHNLLQRVIKLAVMNTLPNLSFIGKENKIRAVAHDRKNDLSNNVSTDLQDYNGKDFDASFKVENLKIMPDDYTVEIMLDGFAKFTSKSKNVKYFIALENQ